MGVVTVRTANQIFPSFDERRTHELRRRLEGGTDSWNRWRQENPHEVIDLRGVSLFNSGVSLRGVNLSGANLEDAGFGKVALDGSDLSASYALRTDFRGARMDRANLQGAYLVDTDFTLAHLARADLRVADLSGANLMMVDATGANFRRANLSHASIVGGSFTDAILAQVDLSDGNLRESNLTNVDLRNTNLNGACLVETNLQDAKLDGCRVFGTSVWKSNLEGTTQANLIITPAGETEITVDNLKIAQFLYLILNNREVRDVIDTITSKVVLILGRFTSDRKPALDAIRDALRALNYTPILFDFTRPASRNYIETVSTLAGMARFVIADVTDAKVVLQEIHVILREYPSVPVQPLLLRDNEPTTVLLDFMDFASFLPIHQYADVRSLTDELVDKVIAPAEAKAAEIVQRRNAAERVLAGLRSQHDAPNHRG